MSDAIAATRANAVKRAEAGLELLDEAEKLLRGAVGQCDGLRGGQTIGEYPTNIAHPVEWEIDKLVTVVRSKLERQRQANLNRA